MLEQFHDGERLSRRTVLTGKVEGSATSKIDAVSLEKKIIIRNKLVAHRYIEGCYRET